MSQDEDKSYYRPMTAEEISEENEKFQRKLTEKMHKELPAKMNALWDLVEESFDGEEEHDNGFVHAANNLPNGHGTSTATNGYQNGGASFYEEREMLLKVRERENNELTKVLDELRGQYQRDVNELRNEVSRLTVEKQRTSVSLNTCQESMKTLKDRYETLQENYDKVIESERLLKNELELYKLTVDDKDKMIKILESGTEDNRKALELENQMQMKDERHKAEIKNFNDQLDLSFKKCKSYEREVFDLERKVKALQNKNDEILLEKSETITRLMGQIKELQSNFEKSIVAPSNSQSNLENEITIRNLRTQLADKDVQIQILQSQLTDAKRVMEERQNSSNDSDRRRESTSLRERILDLELKLTEKEVQLATLTVKKSTRPPLTTAASVQTDPWSVDDNNTQYLRFHEERMADLRQELEEQRQRELEERDAIIESLKSENEQVKRLYIELETEKESVDVRKLQEELSTAKDRLLELSRSHSEFCQPDLDKREREVAILKERVHELEIEISDYEQKEKAHDLAKETSNRIIAELKRLVHSEKEEKKKLEIDIGKFERQILTLTDDVSKLEEQMTRMELAHRDELESLRGSQTSRTSVGTSPLRGETSSPKTPSPRVRENQSVCTSPMGKVLTESEIMRLLHNLASKHEEERAHYVARIEELQDILLRASEKLTNSHQIKKEMRDACTMTDCYSAPAVADQSSELVLELWRKLEDIRTRNEQLTVRSRQTEEVEMELSRANEQCTRLQEKVTRLKSDISVANEKYIKLKEHSKSYKEYFRKVILDINEERQKDTRKWKEEREAWERSKVVWERERVKREQALLDLKAQVQNLSNPSQFDGVVNVARLYDQLIASLRNDV